MIATLFVVAGWLVADPTVETAEKAHAVLRQHCSRCHSGEGSEGGDANFLSVASLRENKLIGKKAVDSLLFERMAVRKGGKGDMPPPIVRDRPSQADKDAVQAWLEAGAPDFKIAVAKRQRIALKDLLKLVRDHLRDARREDRAALRFFTLHHLHNNPSVSDSDLRLYRAALAKSLNNLSWSPSIVLPKAIDPAQTLFVLDLRRIADSQGKDWLDSGKWDGILKEYPYGLKYTHHPEEELRRLDEDVADLTNCELPWIRADWFAANANRPPLYHLLLDIPKSARDLEHHLGVDVGASFLSPSLETVARAGFAKSGISGQNRLIERHRAKFGAYWKSYDFLPDSGRSKLTRYPLGPVDLGQGRQHPFPRQAFEHDGGEVIFSLPNGLYGFMLTNGKDVRINAGPVSVVSDSLKTSGTPEIVSGVSCMACHKHGMIDDFKGRAS